MNILDDVFSDVPIKPNAIQAVFGSKRVCLPVIHTLATQELWYPIDVALQSVEVAVNAGANGIFLINQRMSAGRIIDDLLPEIRCAYPDLWVGMNFLGYPPTEALAMVSGINLQGIWTDDAGIDHRPKSAQNRAAEEFRSVKERTGWSGLYFGGTAFKTQTELSPEELGPTAEAAALFVDVVTSSGRATGCAANLSKVITMRNALKNHGFALASGITPENVKDFLPYVDAFLVASGIEKSFGVLDLEKTQQLCQTIREFNIAVSE